MHTCTHAHMRTYDGVVLSLYVGGCMLPCLGCRCPTQLFFYMRIRAMLAHLGFDNCCGLVGSHLVDVYLMCWAWVESNVWLVVVFRACLPYVLGLGWVKYLTL